MKNNNLFSFPEVIYIFSNFKYIQSLNINMFYKDPSETTKYNK